MIRPGSLRVRLLAGAAVWIAVALAVAGLVLSGLFQDHVRRRFESELTTHLDQLAAMLERDAEGRPALHQPLSDPRFQRPLSGLYWQVGTAPAIELRSRSLWDAALALVPDVLADGELHRHAAAGPAGQTLTVVERSVLLPDAVEPLRIAVGGDQAELVAVTRAFETTLAASLGVLALALIAAAVVQVEVGLQPLARLRDALGEVRAGRASRLAGDMPTEVRPLIEELNALLAHVEESVARGRVQAGNLAHALKTDLAVLANEIRALDEGRKAGSGEAAVSAARHIESMRRHVDHHMARARAAALRGVPGVGTPITACVAALARAMRKLHAGEDLEIVVDVPADLVFAGDREDLDEMLGNLVDNACKWARRRVCIAASRDSGGMLRVAVDDDGPGLPPDRRAAALHPGIRLDETVPGSGLGLAVVRDLAGLYGGSLRLSDSLMGGLCAELRLPRARSAEGAAP